MDRRTSLSLIAVGLGAAGTGKAATAPTTGGIKFMVLYGQPPSPVEFDKYYLGTHMPLVAKMPGGHRMETAKCLPQADGSPPAFYRSF